MDRRLAWVLGILFGGAALCFVALMLVVAVALGNDDQTPSGKNRVGVIEIEGEISSSKKALKDIAEFKKDKDLKAIVVRINSPGGAVAPSQEIFEAIRDLGKTKKVVASMGSLAASGGYYIACAAEKIYANPGTLTGSIGVIFQLPNVEGILKWAGVEMRVITAGKLKDVGSPFRAMSPEERSYFETLLKDVHGQFIGAVAEGRKLKPEQVEAFADGRVFTGHQAKEAKLVDELGGINDAVAAAAKLAGLSDEPEVQYPHEEKSFFKELMGDDAKTLVRELTPMPSAGLFYRSPL
jgi:protease-4